MSAPLSLKSTISLNSGHAIPQMGLGVYEMNGQECYEAVTAALEEGYRHIDSAEMYYNEEEAGKAIRDWLSRTGNPRTSVFFTTKLKSNRDYRTAQREIERSLKKTGLTYIDLFLIHAPFPGKKERLASWKALEDAVDAGIIKSIGVSNYGVHHIKELLESNPRIKPSVNQVDLHPFMRRKDIEEICRKEDIALEAWGPLVRGLRFNHPVIQAIAQSHNKSPAQVLIRWGLQHGYIVIPKSVSRPRIAQNAQAFDFELTVGDMERLDGLDEYLITDWDPTTHP